MELFKPKSVIEPNSTIEPNHPQQKLLSDKEIEQKQLEELKASNPWEYYRQMFGKYPYANSKETQVAIDENKIIVLWQFGDMTSDLYKPCDFPGDPPKSDLEENLDKIFNEAGNVLSILYKAGLPSNMAVQLESFGYHYKTNDWGDESKQRYTKFKAYWNNKTVAKIFESWAKGQEVRIRKIAKYWYDNPR